MKAFRHIALLFVLLAVGPMAGAQGGNHIRRAMERARQQREALARAQVNSEGGGNAQGGYLQMLVQDGDTTYFDQLAPIFIFGRGKKNEKDWRDYYKLVWRFARVYPYAMAAAQVQQQVDSVLKANNFGMVKKDRYVNDIQKQLFKNFEGAFRQMSISQGALMIKLIDRESGMSSYEILREYKSGVFAGFWQGVARIFDNDLKAEYDPEGADRDVEELVQIWRAGNFRSLYLSIFWEEPPVVEIKPVNVTPR